MKIFVLKLIALGVLLGGAWLIALEFGGLTWAYVEEQIGAQGYELPETRFIVIGLAACMIAFGFYGFIPAFKGRAPKRTITFEGEHGDVVIQLDPVQATLTRVLLNMPEIKRVNVRVDPDESGKNAVIFADALLQNQPGVSARETARNVTDYIEESAKSLLGLEDLANIQLNVTGIHLNPKASSKAVRETQANRPGPPMQLEYSGSANNDVPEVAPLEEEPVEEVPPTAAHNQYTTVDITAAPSTEAEEETASGISESEIDEAASEDLPEVEAINEVVEEPVQSESDAANLGGFDESGEEVTSSAFHDEPVADDAEAGSASDEANDDADDADDAGDQPEEKRGWKLFS